MATAIPRGARDNPAAPSAPALPGVTVPGQPQPSQAIPRGMTPPPAPGSAGPGSYEPPPGFTYDPTTGQYVPTGPILGGGQYDPRTGLITYPSGSTGQPPIDTSPVSGVGKYFPTPAPTPTPPPGGGGGGGGGGVGGGIGGGLTLRPPPAPPALPLGFSDLMVNPFSSAAAQFTPPSYEKPPPFAAPSIADALNNPGYAFVRDEGRRSLQNWAAAKGTLNDSETANALEQYGQNVAQTNYQNVYNNELQRYMTNYATQYTDPYAINFQKNATNFSNAQTSWQDLYNSWLASQQLLAGQQGLAISGANATSA